MAYTPRPTLKKFVERLELAAADKLSGKIKVPQILQVVVEKHQELALGDLPELAKVRHKLKEVQVVDERLDDFIVAAAVQAIPKPDNSTTGW